MRGHLQYAWLWALVDMLLVLTAALLALVFIVLPAINDATPEADDKLKAHGSVAVNIVWDPGGYDVDLHLSAPGDEVVNYQRRVGKVWALLRDDMGTVNDPSPINAESAFARGLKPGEYTINLYGYSLSKPVTVYAEVGYGTDKMKLLARREITLGARQERTLLRFRVDSEGKVVPDSVTTIFKTLRKS